MEDKTENGRKAIAYYSEVPQVYKPAISQVAERQSVPSDDHGTLHFYFFHVQF